MILTSLVQYTPKNVFKLMITTQVSYFHSSVSEKIKCSSKSLKTHVTHQNSMWFIWTKPPTAPRLVTAPPHGTWRPELRQGAWLRAARCQHPGPRPLSRVQ